MSQASVLLTCSNLGGITTGFVVLFCFLVFETQSIHPRLSANQSSGFMLQNTSISGMSLDSCSGFGVCVFPGVGEILGCFVVF